MATGLSYEKNYHGSYSLFGKYRTLVAKAYNPILGELYKKSLIYELTGKKFTENEIKKWNTLCNDDLDIFLWHSDCDGKFTPRECKRIFDALKNLKVDFVINGKDIHDLWLNIFRHCYLRRVNLYFS